MGNYRVKFYLIILYSCLKIRKEIFRLLLFSLARYIMIGQTWLEANNVATARDLYVFGSRSHMSAALGKILVKSNKPRDVKPK